MKRTVGLVAAMAVGAALWWGAGEWSRDGRAAAACSSAVGPDPLVVESAPFGSAVDAAGGDPRDALRDRYEPPPDQRFVYAFLAVDCLVSGEEPARLVGAFEAGTWTLTYRGDPVGRLPSLPDFPDAMRWLTDHVGDRAARSGFAVRTETDDRALTEVRARLDAFEAAGVTDALRRLDELWARSAGSSELLELAARGLVYLSMLADDPLELADPLAGRGLAALVLSRSLGGSDLRREEALLALEMGYAAHAHRVAATLSEEDPVRLFVLDETEALARFCPLRGRPSRRSAREATPVGSSETWHRPSGRSGRTWGSPSSRGSVPTPRRSKVY